MAEPRDRPTAQGVTPDPGLHPAFAPPAAPIVVDPGWRRIGWFARTRLVRLLIAVGRGAEAAQERVRLEAALGRDLASAAPRALLSDAERVDAVEAAFDGLEGPWASTDGFTALGEEAAEAALAAGGLDEGPPGFRPSYGAHFYVSYLRDPQGNKIALFSSDPSEPGRDD